MSDTAGLNRVALVDDDDDLRAATTQLLTLAGHEVLCFDRGQAALAGIGADFAGVIVTDVRMPGMSGIELFRALQARDSELPVILMTGHGDIAMAVDALKAGAWDFLSKPFDGADLLAAIGRALKTRTLTLENRRLRALSDGTGGLIGDSAPMRRLRELIPVLAQSDLDVVVEGATGTGKTLFARTLHRASTRARHRFLAIDCATLPQPLVDGELFASGGVIARADRGTLMLDNLDRAPDALQHRLALFAERRAVALEGRAPEPVNVRIVAAIDDVGRERVLPALFHRIGAAPVRLPRLDERREDIPLLVAQFASDAADRHKRPAPPLAELAHDFARRDWPGGVRELERAVERAVLGLEEIAVAGQSDLPLPARLDAFERSVIVEALAAANGEVAAAIRALGIPRKTFYYRVSRLGLDLRALRADLRAGD